MGAFESDDQEGGQIGGRGWAHSGVSEFFGELAGPAGEPFGRDGAQAASVGDGRTAVDGDRRDCAAGFYEFDSAENALTFAQGPFAEEARRAGAPATTRLFDGDIVKDASIDLNSPYYD
ncbi:MULTISPECIES: hypothetical protein [unclassified Streptomyces]|uniref:hypothetical protein n=1 Tax=unclassified Streptomyces TaxID=2593676 RepID=UPI001942061E|nr:MULTISPECIES: hypothetical protein [unclassified Streptomyces]